MVEMEGEEVKVKIVNENDKKASSPTKSKKGKKMRSS